MSVVTQADASQIDGSLPRSSIDDYRDIESWALANGARWMRLGVVQGNTRAERFWASLGYIEMRTRTAVVMSRKTNTVRVMVKPLSSDLERYLALMPRDRPE